MSEDFRKFRRGDKVRCIDTSGSNTLSLNDVYTISSCTRECMSILEVPGVWHPSRFYLTELSGPPPVRVGVCFPGSSKVYYFSNPDRFDVRKGDHALLTTEPGNPGGCLVRAGVVTAVFQASSASDTCRVLHVLDEKWSAYVQKDEIKRLEREIVKHQTVISKLKEKIDGYNNGLA